MSQRGVHQPIQTVRILKSFAKIDQSGRLSTTRMTRTGKSVAWTATLPFRYATMAKKLDGQDSLGKPTVDKTAHLQAIMAAGRRIHAVIDTIDIVISERLGVHRGDLRCLFMLEAGPTTPGEVAARTGLTSGSVTALVDRLACAGFVVRCRSQADRRSVELVMPPAKKRELQAIHDEIEEAIRTYFQGKDASEIADTGHSLEMFAAALDGYAARYMPGAA